MGIVKNQNYLIFVYTFLKKTDVEIKNIKNNSEKLILVFAGWGMDEKAFSHLSGDGYDIIIHYNYTSFKLKFCNGLDCPHTDINISCPIYRTFKKYKEVNVIAYGTGVWAASYAFSTYLRHLESKGRFRVLRLLKKIKKTVAINGTLCPISNIWGIRQNILNKAVATLKKEVSDSLTYSTSSCMKVFNQRVLGNNKEPHQEHNNILPDRALEDIYNELVAIKENFIFSNAIFWNKVIISDNDLIMPTKNQERFWSEYEMCIDKSNRMSFNAHDFSIHHINAPHFPFHIWESWDDML